MYVLGKPSHMELPALIAQWPHPQRNTHPHIHSLLMQNSLPNRSSSSFRSCICHFVICAKPMASRRTFQLGGCRPSPCFHFVSPACTASSSSPGLLSMHAVIAAESSPTPSRTALTLPAAFLLTYSLKSMRWSGWSVERAP